eukprot:GHVS01075345.1.p1 GENE.GHVS01075345.1~~GHVS01075345.1.p1  ORF type:complete len:159 (-),score=12.78 GHVS01075345.1:593-1069(-)
MAMLWHAVLMAEVVNYTFPRLTHLHNYSAANSRKQKLYNWSTLNNKVLSRLGFRIHQDDIEDIIESKPGAVERVLYAFQRSIGDIKTHLKLEGTEKRLLLSGVVTAVHSFAVVVVVVVSRSSWSQGFAEFRMYIDETGGRRGRGYSAAQEGRGHRHIA